MYYLLLVRLLGCALAVWTCGCAHDLQLQAQSQAKHALRCEPPGLRVRAVGVLQGRAPYALEVSVFDAEGCDAEQRYFCAANQACSTTLDTLLPKSARAGMARALWLLRTQTRARCPGETQRVVVESESLFVLETCDGRWEYHCRAQSCERLK